MFSILNLKKLEANYFCYWRIIVCNILKTQYKNLVLQIINYKLMCTILLKKGKPTMMN